MIHFRNKNDIVDWLEKNCPRRAIVRALREGQVELLGGFDSLVSNPRWLPGWIIRVTSRFGKTWIVAIIADQELRIRILKSIPWENWWPKDNMSYGASTVYGDHPDQYRMFRDEAKKEWLAIPEALMYLLSLGAATNKLRLKAWVKKGRVSKSGRQVYLHARGAGGDPSYLMFRPDWIDKFLEEVNS